MTSGHKIAGWLMLAVALIHLNLAAPTSGQSQRQGTKSAGKNNSQSTLPAASGGQQLGVPFYQIRDGKTSARRIQQQQQQQQQQLAAPINPSAAPTQQAPNSAPGNANANNNRLDAELENAFQMIMGAGANRQPTAAQQQVAGSPDESSFSQMNINSFNQLVGQAEMGDFLVSTVAPRQELFTTSAPITNEATSSSLDQATGGGSSTATAADFSSSTESSSGGDTQLAAKQQPDQQQQQQSFFGANSQQSTPSSLSMSLDGMIVNSRPRSDSAKSPGRTAANQQQQTTTAATLPTARIGELEPTTGGRLGNSMGANQEDRSLQGAKASRRVPLAGAPFVSPVTKGQRTKPKASNQFVGPFMDSADAGNSNNNVDSGNNGKGQRANAANFQLAADQQTSNPNNNNNNNQASFQMFGMPAMTSFMNGNSQEAGNQERQQPFDGSQTTQGFDEDQQSRLQDVGAMTTPVSTMGTGEQGSNLMINAQPIVNNDMVMSVVSSPDGKDRRIVMVARNTLDALQRFANAAAVANNQEARMNAQTSFFASNQQQQATPGRGTDSSLVTGVSNNWWPSMQGAWNSASTKTGAARQQGEQPRTTQSPLFVSTLSGTTNPQVLAMTTSTMASSSPSTPAPTTTTTQAPRVSGELDGDEMGQPMNATGVQRTTGVANEGSSFREVPTSLSGEAQEANSSSTGGGAVNQVKTKSAGGSSQTGKPSGGNKMTSVSNGKRTNNSGNNGTKIGKKKLNSTSGGSNGANQATTNGSRPAKSAGKSQMGGGKSTMQSGAAGKKSNLATKSRGQSTGGSAGIRKAQQGANNQIAVNAQSRMSTNGQQARPQSSSGTSDNSSSRRPLQQEQASSSTSSNAADEQSQRPTPSTGTTAPQSSTPSSRLTPGGGRRQQQDFGGASQFKDATEGGPEAGANDLGQGLTASTSAFDLDKQLDELERGSGADQQQQQQQRLSPMSQLDGLRASIPGEPRQDYPIYAAPPRTSFDCKAQSCPGGYYADMEAQCQVFHICQSDGRSDTFLCPNGTIFSQQHFVCVWWWQVDCQQSASFYKLNDGIYCNAQFSPVSSTLSSASPSSPSPYSSSSSSSAADMAGFSDGASAAKPADSGASSSDSSMSPSALTGAGEAGGQSTSPPTSTLAPGSRGEQAAPGSGNAAQESTGGASGPPSDSELEQQQQMEPISRKAAA